MQSTRVLIFLFLFVSCASSVIVEQKSCPKHIIYLSSETHFNEEMEEIIWTPWAPFGKVTYDFKKNEACGIISQTSLIFRDDFGSVLSSLVPFFSQTSIFYNR